jgi:hypothetical protein
MIESYPLQWPAGYPRTAVPRSNYKFYPGSFSLEHGMLVEELRRMKASNVVISTNRPLAADGNAYARYGKIVDVGVAVYFTVDNKGMVLCCDRWDSLEANLKALTLSVDAMRGLNRWGVSQIMERAFMGFKALPEKAASFPWWEVLGISRQCSKKEVIAGYKRQSKLHHPSRGGEPHKWKELQDAYAEGLKQTV